MISMPPFIIKTVTALASYPGHVAWVRGYHCPGSICSFIDKLLRLLFLVFCYCLITRSNHLTGHGIEVRFCYKVTLCTLIFKILPTSPLLGVRLRPWANTWRLRPQWFTPKLQTMCHYNRGKANYWLLACT